MNNDIYHLCLMDCVRRWIAVAFCGFLMALYIAVRLSYAGEVPRPESWYRDRVAKAVHGQTEVSCQGGRADVVTERQAIEIDFLHKHHESLGQALWYAWTLHRQPVMALILDTSDSNQVATLRLVRGIVMSNSSVRVWAVDARTGAIVTRTPL